VYYALNYLMTCHADSAGSASTTLSEAWGRMMHSSQNGGLWAFLKTGDLQLVYKWTPGPYGWATLIGFGLFVLVSLLTRPEDRGQIEQFFDKMRYTSDEPGTLAAERGQDMLLLDLPGWFTAERWQGFFRRYREDLIGFLLGWATVGGLILLAWAILQIGK